MKLTLKAAGAACLFVAVLLTACGGIKGLAPRGQSAGPPPQVIAGVVATPRFDGGELARAQEALVSMPAPDGVDAGLWHELAAALVQALQNREASAFPAGAANLIDDLQCVDGSGNGDFVVSWSYRNTGDYDLNGEVNIGDLVQIAQYFRATPNSPDWNEAQKADGNKDGEVGIADVTTIAQNFRAQVGGYKIYGGGSDDGPWTQAGDVPRSAADTSSYPPRFSYDLGPAEFPLYLVMPYDFAGLDGSGGGTGGAQPAPLRPRPEDGILQDNVVFLGQQPGELSPVISQTEDTMTLRGIRGDIEPGSVIFSNAGAGAVRRVVSVGIEGDVTVLHTTDASLPEVFAELDVDFQLPFSQEALGDIEADEEGLNFEWVEAQQSSAGHSASAAGASGLRINFTELKLDAPGGPAATLSGSVTLDADPHFTYQLNTAPGDLLPSVTMLNAGCTVTMQGGIHLKGVAGVNLDTKKVWYKKELKPVRAGVLVFIPELIVESKLSGSLGANVKLDGSAAVTATGLFHYDAETGDEGAVDHLITTDMAATAEGPVAFNAELQVLKVTLTYNLSGVAGPFGEVHCGFKGSATDETQDGVEGLRVKVDGRAGGSAGISGKTSLFKSSLTLVSIPFEIEPIQLFNEFFPLHRPVAQLSAEPLAGPAPLAVSFDASGSSDPKGSPLSYSWDFGDGAQFDSEQDPHAEHVYNDSGTFTARVTVTNAQGAEDSAEVQVSVDNFPPVAVISAEVISEDPFIVLFDASASTDADGEIVKYEWDWENDGIYDHDSAATAVFSNTYGAPGSYTARVRVTDDDGATDTASVAVEAEEPPDEWLIINVDESGAVLGSTSLAVVDGAPAISYWYNNGFNFVLNYAYSIMIDGSSDWTTLTVDGTSSDAGAYNSLAVINGKPAIGYWDTGWNAVEYAVSSKADGSSGWTTVTVDNAGLQGQFATLALINNKPAISYLGNSVLKYSYFNGSDWVVLTVDGIAGAGRDISLAVINNFPAISYRNSTNNDLKYAYSGVANGSSGWTTLTVDDESSVGYYTSLALVNGKPAISYYDSTNGDLKYAYSNVEDGSSEWIIMILDDNGDVGKYTSLAEVNGKPSISYRDDTNANLKYAWSDLSDGSGGWNMLTVDSEGNVGSYSSLAVLDNGSPAISYHDQTNGNLKYAVLIQ